MRPDEEHKNDQTGMMVEEPSTTGLDSDQNHNNGRSRSPKGLNISPERHHHAGYNRIPRKDRPPAIAFPPDPNEKAKDVIDRIFKAFGLEDFFPQNVVDQVEELCAGAGGTDDPSLVDLTERPFITIDNDNSMDLDQAMYICHADPPTVDGGTGWYAPPVNVGKSRGYLVSYALADGAHFVKAGTALFDHALHRGGVSFYLPGKAIPMLPRKLSENTMSLNENVRRRALTFDMYLDHNGKAIKSIFCWGCILSRWKGTYREVATYYETKDSGRNCPQSEQEYSETLDLLQEVGMKRRAIAEARHVVHYHRDHADIHIDSKGHLSFAPNKSYVSELYNEQISLLVNSEGAKLMKDFGKTDTNGHNHHVQPIFRRQSEPTRQQLDTLESVIRHTVKLYGMSQEEWTWDRMGGDHLSDYLKRLRRQLEAIPLEERGDAENVVKVIERQAMITNVAADFTDDPDESAHHSLKLEQYARFSSPMREIVGCFTHKEFLEAVRGGQLSGISVEEDLFTQKRVIRAARRSKQLQKKLTNAVHLHMLNCFFFKDLQSRKGGKQRPIYEGFIIGMDFSEKSKSSRCYVKLRDPPVEIKVSGEDLNYQYECRYAPTGDVFGRHGTTVEIAPLHGSYEMSQHALPTFRSGQRVKIQVDDYAQYFRDTSRSRWIFAMFPREDIESSSSFGD